MGSSRVVGIVAVMVATLVAAPAAEAHHPTRDESRRVDSSVGHPAVQEHTDSKIPRFWVRDKHRYGSPWYAGNRRKMINFGCTRAPYYDPSPRCRGGRGFHHGLDLAMPCGTKLYAGTAGRVVHPSARGSLGTAYGPWAFRIRNRHFDRDFVIGHVRKVFVRPGERVRRGELIARASDAGAPDGCHLHFEARPISGSYDSAVRPTTYLRLRR